MGVSTSYPSHAYDQIYLPADCFRLCNPSSCFCGGNHHNHHNHSHHNNHCGHHSRSKYVYVERNNPSGRESYRDPMELIERGLVPPGWLTGIGGGFGGGWWLWGWGGSNNILRGGVAGGGRPKSGWCWVL